MKNRYFLYVFLVFMFLNATQLYAHGAWPSLVIQYEIFTTWWIIITGLVIKILFIKYSLKTNYSKSIVMGITINIISFLIGSFVIIYGGLWLQWVNFIFDYVKTGYFIEEIFTWVLTFILIVLCNTFIESLALKLIFKEIFKKIFLWIFCGNILIELICAIKMYVKDLYLY